MGYTNSSLVNYTRISKNSNPRTEKICRISVHIMAGNVSVETCGNVFANTASQVSSNYGIGTDGRIALYVEEKNRSWCTSNKDNDHKAVTIEVANNGGAPNWPVSDKAWDSLVKLCIDICKRNGKNKLIWFNDKNKSLSYSPADNEMIVTVHRWFSNKICPGDYVFNRIEELSTTVTSKLQNNVNSSDKYIPEETPQPEITTDEKYLWNKLDDIGLNDFAKAGMMGNLFSESGLVSNNLQNAFEKKLNLTDETYTTSVDNGTYSNFVRDGAGYGLAQWTYWSRKEALLNYAKKENKSVGDFKTQVNFLAEELNTSFKSMLNKLDNCKYIREASDIILTEFEKPANQSESMKVYRANYSTHFYNLYASKYKIPYTVRVKADVLNIRTSPSNLSLKNGCISDRGIYTIVQESTGPGANLWGKLKSGKGWISLDYTEKT